jgi:hypothetical protein
MVKDKKTYLIAALVLLLILALGYICISKYNEGQQTKLNTVYQQGMQAGAERAQQLIINQIITDLNTNGATAVIIPTSDNKTITIPLVMEKTFISTIVNQLNTKGAFTFTTLDQNNQTVQVQLITPQMCSQVKTQTPSEQ